METYDRVARKVAIGANYEDGLMDLWVERDPLFKELRIIIEGELALTITADPSGHGIIEYHEGSTHTLQGRL